MKSKTILQYLLILITGILGFSYISNYILLQKLQLPFYIVELFLLPSIFMYFNKYINIFVRSIKKRMVCFFILTILLMTAVILGVINGAGFIGALTMSRSLVYIILVAFIFCEYKEFDLSKLYILVLGATIGEFINVAIIAPGLSNYKGIAQVNIIAIALVVLIPVIRRRNAQGVICFSLAFLTAYLSGMRTPILICVITYIIANIYVVLSISFTTRKKVIKLLLMGVILSVVIGAIILRIDIILNRVAEIFHMDSYTIFRISDRMKAFLNFDFVASQDTSRIEGYKKIFSEFIPSLIPRGFIGEIKGVGNYIDVPILFIYDVFGSFFGMILLYIIVKRALSKVRDLFRKKLLDIDVVAAIMVFIYFVLFIINGRFLYITYESILSGIVIGVWFNKNIRKEVSNESSISR